MSTYPRRGAMRCAFILTAVFCLGGTAVGDVITFDTLDDNVTPLANGRIVESPAGFGLMLTISSSGGNLGAVVFDSDPLGPNQNSLDQDLLINSSNLLILQESTLPASTTPGFFDVPNDDREGGVVTFDFAPAGFPIRVDSIDVIDVDNGNSMTLTLIDAQGHTRVVAVPENFTGDFDKDGVGVATINLASGLSQLSPDLEDLFTSVSTDPGFDINDVAVLTVEIDGSGALDNLVFVPEPATLALLCVAMLWGLRRTFPLRRRLR